MSWIAENRWWLDRAADRWCPRTSTPLRIRAWFRAPICWDGRDTIQIEGALQHAMIRMETGRMPDDVFANITREESAAINLTVPILDVEIAGHKIACASSAWPWPISSEGTRNRNKRARPDVIAGDVLHTSGGAYKALRIPVATLHVPFVDFFVVGDRERIESLLKLVGGLGRDTARSLGSVSGWDVSEQESDRSLVFMGRPMRPLPDVDRESFVSGSYDARPSTLRAPYWRSWLRVPALVPTIPIGDQDSWWARAMREEAEAS